MNNQKNKLIRLHNDMYHILNSQVASDLVLCFSLNLLILNATYYIRFALELQTKICLPNFRILCVGY